MRTIFILFLAIAFLIIAGCSKNENDPVGPEPGGTANFELPVDSGAVYYLNLSLSDTVMITTDYLLNDSWDLMIDNLTRIRLNGGLTAPGQVYTHVLDGVDYDQLKAAPDGLYITDSQTGDVVGENWYFYDINTHTVNPLDYVYVIRATDNNFYKFKITETSFTTMYKGVLKIRMEKISAPSSPEFQSVAGRVMLTRLPMSSSALHYFSFADGGIVEISDPTSNNDWDIETDYVDIAVNGGTSGPGQGGGVIYEDTEFDAIDTAPLDGYVQDDTTAQTMAIGDKWYNYDFMTHTLTPHPHVFVVKTAKGKYAKIEFVKTQFNGQAGGMAIIRHQYLESGNTF